MLNSIFMYLDGKILPNFCGKSLSRGWVPHVCSLNPVSAPTWWHNERLPSSLHFHCSPPFLPPHLILWPTFSRSTLRANVNVDINPLTACRRVFVLKSEMLILCPTQAEDRINIACAAASLSVSVYVCSLNVCSLFYAPVSAWKCYYQREVHWLLTSGT